MEGHCKLQVKRKKCFQDYESLGDVYKFPSPAIILTLNMIYFLLGRAQALLDKGREDGKKMNVDAVEVPG